jgi:hypothetical protein
MDDVRHMLQRRPQSETAFTSLPFAETHEMPWGPRRASYWSSVPVAALPMQVYNYCKL